MCLGGEAVTSFGDLSSWLVGWLVDLVHIGIVERFPVLSCPPHVDVE